MFKNMFLCVVFRFFIYSHKFVLNCVIGLKFDSEIFFYGRGYEKERKRKTIRAT